MMRQILLLITREVLLLNPVPVVTQLQTLRALSPQSELHHVGPGVQAVLQQFLNIKQVNQAVSGVSGPR